MNESETRAELIDPKLKASGWGVVEGSRVLREYHITKGKIQSGYGQTRPMIADYILVFRNRKLAVIEAKSCDREVGEGVMQAKIYGEKLHLGFAYATNGKEIYQISMESGREGLVASFPTPTELWNKTFDLQNSWMDKFNTVPLNDLGGTKKIRFYQEIAINKTMQAITEGKDRILLTLATGTGKTFIAFQIAWKLFLTRWNLQRDAKRQPRILFLADRNILADQAFNAFSAFPEDALIRIRPDEIRKKGKVPTTGSIFFTIFQTFMCEKEPGKKEFTFGEYPNDFFDLIIIDECHRGGANDESNWRGILEYFKPAIQLGLTATPKRDVNVDTYRYFGDPVYIYSLKEGINDGFLTPFKVKRIQTTMDEYVYTSDDFVIEGEVEAGKRYTEPDFNRIIEIKEREAKRVQLFLDEINQKEKGIIFCANQPHAAIIRDLVNQYKDSKDPLYCVRVTANDGEMGEQYLREFQDNEKTIPTILTTSQKLSTGVDARNIRSIILMRPIHSMIEFKQIIGRGTRLFEGKEFFTIFDFVDACHHFSDPEWDGEPVEPEPRESGTPTIKDPPDRQEDPKDPGDDEGEKEKKPKLKIKLADGKVLEIQHMIKTSYWSADGKPISAEEFILNLYGELPKFFKDEKELREIWSDPVTRKVLLTRLEDAGYGKEQMTILQNLINAQNSDLLDVLEYISFANQPITRAERVQQARQRIFLGLDSKQQEFIEFVLSKYIESGVEELDQDKLSPLLILKYHALQDATDILGGVTKIKDTFVSFQHFLYEDLYLKL